MSASTTNDRHSLELFQQASVVLPLFVLVGMVVWNFSLADFTLAKWYPWVFLSHSWRQVVYFGVETAVLAGVTFASCLLPVMARQKWFGGERQSRVLLQLMEKHKGLMFAKFCFVFVLVHFSGMYEMFAEF